MMISTPNPFIAAPTLGEPQLVRVAELHRARLAFFLDGREAWALAGDTVLTAILSHQRFLRTSEFDGEARAGFCLIGACQDCWVRTEGGERVRACSTPIAAGMRLVTRTQSVGTSGDPTSPASPPEARGLGSSER